jgi:hypothetical protein
MVSEPSDLAEQSAQSKPKEETKGKSKEENGQEGSNDKVSKFLYNLKFKVSLQNEASTWRLIKKVTDE